MKVTGDSRCAECGRPVVVRDLTVRANRVQAAREHKRQCKELRLALAEAPCARLKYTECPECEACFTLSPEGTFPPHRAFRGPELCPMSGRWVTP